ncbi:MAG: histidine phosphatase family protein [Bacilli bacterium]|nr:histidine phosphatase family protein [Bacilli bacterium]
MRLIVLRHATTAYNEQKRIQGSVNIPLSEIGIKQASSLKKELEKMNIDFTICSPLDRAKMTAALVTDSPILTDYRLTERNLGDYEGMPISTYDTILYANYQTNVNVHNVEPIREVLDRLQSFMQDLKPYADKTILIVTHGGIMKALPYCFQQIPEDGILEGKKTENCDYIEINI